MQTKLVCDFSSVHSVWQILKHVLTHHHRREKRTCLLAKTSNTASRSSSSASILINSSRASPTRSRSLLSTTKMRPAKKSYYEIQGDNVYLECFGNSVSREDESYPARTLVNIALTVKSSYLSTDIPNGEGDVLVFDSFDVES